MFSFNTDIETRYKTVVMTDGRMFCISGPENLHTTAGFRNVYSTLAVS